MKLIILTSIAFGILFQQSSCGYPDTPLRKLKGPEDRNDLVFFYKKDATYEEKEFFQNTVIHKLDPDGNGYDLQDGVIDMFLIRNGDFEGYAINFSTKATPDQRENLKNSIKESSIIYKFYENVVPNDINHL